MGESLEGGCSCGAVRYRMTPPPMIVHCCHCLDCQRLSGGGFAVNILIETDRVELLSGELETTASATGSGREQIIKRCPHCRVAVWSHYPGGRDRLAFVRAGTLDEPSAITPDVHIYTRSKLPWVALPEGALAFEADYKTAEVWPPESLARAAAAMR